MTEEDLKEIIDPILRKFAQDYVNELNKKGVKIQDLEGEEYEKAKRTVDILLGYIPVYIDELKNSNSLRTVFFISQFVLFQHFLNYI